MRISDWSSDVCSSDLQLLADHDPVELRDRTAGMKAAAACGEAMMVGEVAQASSVRAPFVEVAHQHRRRLWIAVPAGEMREDGMRLSPSPQPGQVEMHADDAKIDAADAHIGHHRAARPQRGQVDDFLMDRSEEHTSELQSLMRISYAVFCL